MELTERDRQEIEVRHEMQKMKDEEIEIMREREKLCKNRNDL